MVCFANEQICPSLGVGIARKHVKMKLRGMKAEKYISKS